MELRVKGGVEVCGSVKKRELIRENKVSGMSSFADGSKYLDVYQPPGPGRQVMVQTRFWRLQFSRART